MKGRTASIEAWISAMAQAEEKDSKASYINGSEHVCTWQIRLAHVQALPCAGIALFMLSIDLFKHCLVQASPCAGVALCRHMHALFKHCLVQALPCAGVALCRHMHALYIYIYTLPGQGMCVNQVSLEQSAHAGPWPRPRGLNIHRPVDVSTDEVMCQRMKMTRFVSVLVVSNLLMRQMSHTNEHDRI